MYLGQWYRDTIQGWGVFITKLRDVYKGSFVDNLYEGNNTNTVMVHVVDVHIDKLRRPHMLLGGDATMEVNYSNLALQFASRYSLISVKSLIVI